MRKVRAIVESAIEPQDHEVIWYYKGKLLRYDNGGWQPFHTLDASEIAYSYEEAEGVETLEQALDMLLYVPPKISSFVLKQAGTYEAGASIDTQEYSWSYNKKTMKNQSLNNMALPINVRSARLSNKITKNTTFTLWADDGTNEVTAQTSIKFVNYMYWGTQASDGTVKSRYKANPSAAGLTVEVGSGEYAWIFLPKSCGYTKIWYNNVDSTTDFISKSTKFNTDTGLSVEGTLYVSKNHSLNSVTLKFT